MIHYAESLDGSLTRQPIAVLLGALLGISTSGALRHPSSSIIKTILSPFLTLQTLNLFLKA